MELPDSNRSEVQTLYYSAKTRALEQGIESYDEYVDLIDELIQDRMREGVLVDEDNLPQIQKDLEMMWPKLEREIRRE